MAVEGAPTPVLSSPAGKSLRTVLDMLLQEMILKPVDPDTLPWDRPIFVLRSANLGRMQAFLEQIAIRCPMPTLHIMSHARDEDAVRAISPCDFTFHAYSAPGPYRIEEVPAAAVDGLRSIGFGALFFLDSGTWGEKLDQAEGLVAAIVETEMVSFLGDGTYARASDWRQRRLAESAFLRLIEWYQLKLDPGFPDGPVSSDDAMAPFAR